MKNRSRSRKRHTARGLAVALAVAAGTMTGAGQAAATEGHNCDGSVVQGCVHWQQYQGLGNSTFNAGSYWTNNVSQQLISRIYPNNNNVYNNVNSIRNRWSYYRYFCAYTDGASTVYAGHAPYTGGEWFYLSSGFVKSTKFTNGTAC